MSQPRYNLTGLQVEVTQGQVLFGADGTNPHFAHQTAYELPSGVDMIDLLKLGGEPSGTQIRHPGMPVVNLLHDQLDPLPVFLCGFLGSIVNCAPVQSDQLTLPADRQAAISLDLFWGRGYRFGESNPEESRISVSADLWP